MGSGIELKEIKYLFTFIFLRSSVKTKRGVEFRHSDSFDQSEEFKLYNFTNENRTHNRRFTVTLRHDCLIRNKMWNILTYLYKTSFIACISFCNLKFCSLTWFNTIWRLLQFIHTSTKGIAVDCSVEQLVWLLVEVN